MIRNHGKGCETFVLELFAKKGSYFSHTVVFLGNHGIP